MSALRAMPGTVVVIVVLAVVFLWELAVGAMGDPIALLGLGALPSDGRLNGEYWRVVTYSLLHLDSTHIVANVALLAWVGRIVERRIGTTRFALIYVISVLAAGVAIVIKDSLAPSSGASVGASGGVFGLLGASIVFVFRADMARFGQDRGVRTGLLVCLAIALAISFLPGVSFAGHVGGLVAGLALGQVVGSRDEPGLVRRGLSVDA